MRPPSPGASPWLVVDVQGEVRALERESVREIARLVDLTPVPGAPPSVRGLTHLHGRIVAVLDPRHDGRSDVAAEARPQLGDPLLLLEGHGDSVALWATRVREPERHESLDAGNAVDVEALLVAARGSSPARDRPVEQAPALIADHEMVALQDFFRVEAALHLDAAEEALRRLDHPPGRADGSVPHGGGSAQAFASLLRELHTLKGSAGAVGMTRVGALAHQLEDHALRLRQATPPDDEAAPESGRRRGQDERDALRAALANLRLEVARSDGPATTGGGDGAAAGGAHPARVEPAPPLSVEPEHVDDLMEAVGQLVIDRARIVRRLQDMEGALARLGSVGEGLHALEGAARTGPALSPETLARAAATLAETAARLRDVVSGVVDETDGLRRTTRSLQDGLQRIRTDAVSKLFARLEGALRELAERAGRAIDVTASGADTAIDRAMMGRLHEPLLQLVRNAVAHGLEPPERRVAVGKPPSGRVTLSARQRGDRIVIEVSDDGAGVDLAGVRRAMVRAGRIDAQAAARLDHEAVLAAIFTPGISTRADPDALAGRGIGLDVVKEALARLGGTIACASTPGQGTRFTVRLPLTTAIVPALLFKVDGQVYAVPADSVVSVHEARPLPLGAVAATPIVDESSISARPPAPIAASLSALLAGARFDRPNSTPRDPPGEAEPGAAVGHAAPATAAELPGLVAAAAGSATPELVLDGAEGRFRVRCDKVIGEREIVVKCLGALFAGLPIFAGATVSGAGKVQLILDVDELSRRAGPGARVDVDVPSVGAAPGAAPSAPPGRDDDEPPAPNILVVDDSSAARAAAVRLLTRAGYLVDTAVDGEQAWVALEARRPDLVVSDLEMPVADGYALLARLRADERFRALPVLIVSSGSPAAAARALALGADDFLSKLHLVRLCDAVRKLLAAPRPTSDP